MPRLQVRQLTLSGSLFDGIGRPVYRTNAVLTYGPWTDFPNGNWLVGFVLPGPTFAYEFRTTEEDA